jgi:hypothetical protein
MGTIRLDVHMQLTFEAGILIFDKGEADCIGTSREEAFVSGGTLLLLATGVTG